MAAMVWTPPTMFTSAVWVTKEAQDAHGLERLYNSATIEGQANIVKMTPIHDTEHYAMAYALLKFMQQGYFASFTDGGASIDLCNARRYIVAFNCACELNGVPHRRLG
jgi:hypothetical protein